MYGLNFALPPRSLLWPFATVFLVMHFLHLSLVAFIENSIHQYQQGFIAFWLYAITHAEIAILHYLLISGMLVLVLIFSMRLTASQFTQVGKELSLLLPLGPLLDIIFHFTSVIAYRSFQNSFQSDLTPARRLVAALSPGVEDELLYFTWGHRIVFVLLSLCSAVYVWRRIGGIARPLFTFVASYLSISAVLAFLSPSDVPPPVQVSPLLQLSVVLWIGNVFLLLRSEFTSNKA